MSSTIEVDAREFDVDALGPVNKTLHP